MCDKCFKTYGIYEYKCTGCGGNFCKEHHEFHNGKLYCERCSYVMRRHDKILSDFKNNLELKAALEFNKGKVAVLNKRRRIMMCELELRSFIIRFFKKDFNNKKLVKYIQDKYKHGEFYI